MSLSIEVGLLAWYISEGDEEGVAWIQRDMLGINRLLQSHHLPAHAEPQSLPKLNDRCRLKGMPYSWIHYLRRAYAYAKQAPTDFTPLAEDQDSGDPRVNREVDLFESHLICHSDTDGYYVPVDFATPLYDEPETLVGAVLGSSQAAMRELVQVAPLINIRLRKGELSDALAKKIGDEGGGSLYIERQVWLQLYEVFRLSIEHGACVKFC